MNFSYTQEKFEGVVCLLEKKAVRFEGEKGTKIVYR
jgi:hypothetical protein